MSYIKYIKIPISSIEHEAIKHEAKAKHLKVQEYARMKLLDQAEGVDSLKRRIICMMPSYYNLVESVNDPKQKKCLYGWGEELWQSLK